jgi:hypothetical protein
MASSDICHAFTTNNKNVVSDIFSGFTVVDSSYKYDTPLIIFVNDMHTNPDIQKLIFNLLSKLHDCGVLNYVFAEGAPHGKIDISNIDGKDDGKKKIMDIFLFSGLASGAEVFAVNNDFRNIYGLEDWAIYVDNLKTASKKHENNESFLSAMKERLYYGAGKKSRGIIKTIEEVKNPDKNTGRSIRKTGSIFGDFSIDLKYYDEINKYLTIAQLKESLNEKNAYKDIYSVWEFLKKNIPYSEFVKLTEEPSKSGSGKFLSDLYALLNTRFNDILIQFPNLARLLYLNELKNSLNPNKLILQTEILQDGIISSSYADADVYLYFLMDILDKYKTLTVSEKEFYYVLENKSSILKTCFKYLNKEDYLKISEILSDDEIVKYYENNILRNSIFYKNIQRTLAGETPKNNIIFNNKSYKSVNVAVIGGFHGTTVDLIKDDLSYISLMPTVCETSQNLYKSVIQISAASVSSALAPPLISIGLEGNNFKALIDFWAGFDNIYSQKTIKAVNDWFSKRKIPLKAAIDKNKRIIINNIENKQETKLKSFLNPIRNLLVKIFNKQKQKQNIIRNYSTRESVIMNEYSKTLDSLNGAMPDIVLICVKNKDDIKYYKNALKKLKSLTPLGKVNFKFIHVSDNGTGASFVGIAQYIKSLKKRIRFKNIKYKQWSDLKICAINIDGLDKSAVCRELPFNFNARKITSLELSILNGVRACQSFGGKGGIALMNPGNVYIGNMKPESEITIISSMASYNEILNYKMPWIMKDETGKKNIPKIYYNFDIEKIGDKLERKSLLEKASYLDNREIRQFETTTGNILFRFEDENIYLSFWEHISKLYSYIYGNENAANFPPALDFIQHILIPVLRMKNHEDSLSYFVKMSIDKEFGEFYENYSSFFDSLLNPNFQNIIENINISTYKQPHSLYVSLEETILPQDFIEYEYTPASDFLQKASDNTFINSIEHSYNQLFQTIINTRLKKKSYDTQRRKSVLIYKDMVKKCETNIELIDKYIAENSGIPPNDAQTLKNLKKLFILSGYYSLEYLRILDSFENISIFGGYIFPKSSIFERSKIMHFNRMIFGMHTNFQKEKESLRKQIFKLCALGNSISGSMYDYYALLYDVNTFIIEKEHPAEKTYLGIEKRWGDRKAIQRILSIFLTIQSLAYAFIAALASVHGNLLLIGQTGVIGTIIFSLCTGLGLSVFLHRFMIFIGKRNKFYLEKIKNFSKTDEAYFKKLKYISDEDTLLIEISKDLEDLKNAVSKDNSGLLKKIHKAEEKVQLYFKEGDKRTLSQIREELSNILTEIDGNAQYKAFYSNIYFQNLVLPSENSMQNLASSMPQKDIVNASQNYLLKWHGVLYSGDLNVNTLEIMRKYALQIIKITVFNKDIFIPENKEQIISIIQDFSLLYNASMDKIKNMTDLEKESAVLEIKSFEEIGKYAQSYYKALSYAMNADILNGYRISKNTKLFFLEKLKILAAVRYVMGINFGIYASQKGFLKSMHNLINIGNALVPGLYDNEKIISFSEQYLYAKSHPKKFDIGINEPWKFRKMLTRLFPLMFFLINSIGNGFYESPYRFFMVFITGVGVSIVMHWISIVYGLLYTKVSNIIYGIKNEKPTSEHPRNEIIKSKASQLSKVRYGRVPDVLFISISSDNVGINEIKEAIKKIMSKGNLKNVKIEFIINSGPSDTNVLIEILSYINSGELKIKYPETADKDISEIEAIILNIGNSNHKNILDEIAFAINSEKTTPLEISLLNSVGLIQNNVKKGSLVIADPSYVYLGNLKQSGDIMLLSAQASYEQIRSQNLPLFIAGEIGEEIPGQSLIKKIYKTFEPEQIPDNMLRKTLENIIKKQGSEEQVSTFSGLMSISLSGVKAEGFAHYIDALRNFVENYEGTKFPIDFFHHIMIPYIMLNNGESADVYLSKMAASISNRGTRKQYYDFFSRIFALHKEFYINSERPLKINIVQSPETMLSKADPTNEYYNFIKSFLERYEDKKEFDDDLQKVERSSILTPCLASIKHTLNPISTSNKLANEVTQNISHTQKICIFLSPNLNPDYKRHAQVSRQAGINSISAVLENNIENFGEDGTIINIPIEDTEVSAKVIIKKLADDCPILTFAPLYSGTLSEKECEIINSILSQEYDNGIDALRKRVFLGRGMLAFLKESLSSGKQSANFKGITKQSLQNNLISLISIDGAGVFANPQTIDDIFFNDETLNKINFCSIYINKNISEDIIVFPPEEKIPLKLPQEAENFNIIAEKTICLGLISALFSKAAFILNFGRSINAEIDSQDYKLVKLDKNIFYTDAKKYINSLFDVISALTPKNGEENIETSTENTTQRIIPSLNLNIVSDILVLNKLADPAVINSAIISNLYAETDKGSVIGNIFNPMLADLKMEMNRIGYKDNSFLGLMFEEKAELKSWKNVPSRFYAAGILLSYLKTKPKEVSEFEKFKKTNFITNSEKGFEYMAALILSGKNFLTDEEIVAVKSAYAHKWDNAIEQIKYMEYMVFNQLRESCKKLKEKGIKLFVKVNLMTLAQSAGSSDGFLESCNNGEKILFAQYNGISKEFAVIEKLNFLKESISFDGFLITNIDSYKDKRHICEYLRKKLQNGLNDKTILIYEDNDTEIYQGKENTYALTSKNVQNAIYKTGISDSTGVEEMLYTIKNCGFDHINFTLSFFSDAAIKLENISRSKREMKKSFYSDQLQYYMLGYREAKRNKTLSAEAGKIIISDEEKVVYKIKAKGILIFNAIYSYIKTNGKEGEEFFAYISEGSSLFQIARKYLSNFDSTSPVMRYIDVLELKNNHTIAENKHLYTMQLIGFVNGLIDGKYKSVNEELPSKVSAFADSFFIKDNFINYIPQTSDIMSLYGLYLGGGNKNAFASKLYKYFKNWQTISDNGSNTVLLLWLIEQFSLFCNDLYAEEKYELTKKIIPYLDNIVEKCRYNEIDSLESEALYLNALIICSSANKIVGHSARADYLEDEIYLTKNSIKEKYFENTIENYYSPDILMLFSLSALINIDDFNTYIKKSAAKFKKYALTEYGAIKKGSAYPFYLYYYLMHVSHSERKTLLETLILYLEDNLTLPEFFVKKEGFAKGGEYRGRVSAAYFAMIFKIYNERRIKINFEKNNYNGSLRAVKNILFAA